MTTPETATVTTLTAELRVLQINRRQVTKTIFEQLDRVSPEELAPFGRVQYMVSRRIGQRWEYQDLQAVVGRHASNGSLVWCSRWAYEEKTGLAWPDLPLIVLAGLR